MTFSERYAKETHGSLSGFDRLLFSGHLQSFFPSKGMYYYLSKRQVKLTDYKQFMADQTKAFRSHMEELARESAVDIIYLNHSRVKKEELAKSFFSQSPTKQGLVCMISSQEVAYSFSLVSNKAKQELEIVKQKRKHLHYYCYYMDPEFGWMFAKIQSWYPFTMHIYVNGKEYLKRALSDAAIDYHSYANSLSWVSDLTQAQALADRLVEKKWDRFLTAFARQLNPHLSQIEEVFEGYGYRWSIHQCEYATDVLFKEREVLEGIYPALVQHATYFKGGEDIYTFFGRNLHHKSTKEVTGNTKRFIQGFRVKHYLDRNSIKMYDKHTVLRVETTINHPRAFKIYKEVQRKGKQTKAWVPMGKAVSNLYRYAQIARRANLRYLDSLAAIGPAERLDKHIEKVSDKTTRRNKNNKEKPFSAFNLLSKQTCLLLEAINDGRFAIKPFTNKELRKILIKKGFFETKKAHKHLIKKWSNQITRLIAKLRAHGLVKKIPHSFSYRLTVMGQKICNSILRYKNSLATT